MSISQTFHTYLLERLSAIEPIAVRKMFGGLGLYARGVIFAIADNDVMYLKVDDALREVLRAAGEHVWQPGGGQAMNGYFSVSEDVLEDPDQLRDWVRQAIGVGERAKPKPSPSKPTRHPKATRAAKGSRTNQK